MIDFLFVLFLLAGMLLFVILLIWKYPHFRLKSFTYNHSIETLKHTTHRFIRLWHIELNIFSVVNLKIKKNVASCRRITPPWVQIPEDRQILSEAYSVFSNKKNKITNLFSNYLEWLYSRTFWTHTQLKTIANEYALDHHFDYFNLHKVEMQFHSDHFCRGT